MKWLVKDAESGQCLAMCCVTSVCSLFPRPIFCLAGVRSYLSYSCFEKKKRKKKKGHTLGSRVIDSVCVAHGFVPGYCIRGPALLCVQRPRWKQTRPNRRGIRRVCTLLSFCYCIILQQSCVNPFARYFKERGGEGAEAARKGEMTVLLRRWPPNMPGLHLIAFSLFEIVITYGSRRFNETLCPLDHRSAGDIVDDVG